MEEVLYVKHKKSDQYWRRDTDFPDVFFDYNALTRANADYTTYDDNNGLLLTMSREDTAEVIRLRDRELWRRWNGIYMMNFGELTYLTGCHYFQLQWGAVKDYENPYDGSKYGEYREYMRDYQYFRQYCLESKDPHGQRNCSAMLIGKPKKTAITNTEALNFLDESTRTRDKMFGMMSKSAEDVKDTGFAYYNYGLDHLPYVFMPTIANRNLTEVSFGNPRVRATGSVKSVLHQLDNSKGFNTKVYTKGLIATAFDGPVIWRYWCDEWTKYIDPYPNEIYKKTSETVKKQESIQGFGVWTAYVSETDNRDFQEAKALWKDSLMATMDKATNRTKSEFFAYAITADVAGETSFNIYGKADSAKTISRIMAKRKQLENDPSALQAFMRQSPLDSEEMWREGGGGGATFNNLRIGIRKEQILQDIRVGTLPYVHGDLEWVVAGPFTLKERLDPARKGERLALVKFVPTSEEEKMKGNQGPWRIYQYDKLPQDAFNRPVMLDIRDAKGYLMPGEDTAYIGATDPTEYAFKSNVKTPSMCASTVMNFHNSARNSLYGEVVTKRFVSTYLFRRENPADTLEDIVKKVLFWGCYEAAEANREWIYTEFTILGLQNFMLVRDAKTRAIVPYKPNEHQTLLRTVSAGSMHVIEDYVKAKTMYYATPTGDDPDYLYLMEDERILEQDMQFKPEDTKKYDISVCSSWNILGLESFFAYLERTRTNRTDRYDPRSMELVKEYLLS